MFRYDEPRERPRKPKWRRDEILHHKVSSMSTALFCLVATVLVVAIFVYCVSCPVEYFVYEPKPVEEKEDVEQPTEPTTTSSGDSAPKEITRKQGLVLFDKWIKQQVELIKQPPYTCDVVEKFYKKFQGVKEKWKVNGDDLQEILTKHVKSHSGIGLMNKLKIRNALESFAKNGFTCAC